MKNNQRKEKNVGEITTIIEGKIEAGRVKLRSQFMKHIIGNINQTTI